MNTGPEVVCGLGIQRDTTCRALEQRTGTGLTAM